MAHKKKTPAAVATAAGAQDIAVSMNTATIAQTGGNANSPVITGIRRGPGGNADWLVSIEDVCTDVPMREQKLRRSRRFCNVLWYRFGVNFDPMLQDEWLAIVDAAIAAEGDVS